MIYLEHNEKVEDKYIRLRFMYILTSRIGEDMNKQEHVISNFVNKNDYLHILKKPLNGRIY